MKTFAGKLPVGLALCLSLWMLVPVVEARITAEADRTDIAMGETLRLILTATEGERPDEIDLSQLEQDFEILQRSTATSARIVGGEQNVTRTLELELAPNRDGILTVPAFSYGGRKTTPVAIKVSPQPDIDLGDELVYFDASVSQTEVYVQAQIILTITLQQAINLDNRAISELDIPNTYTEALEQKTYQRRVGGRLWQITELRYALFPQQSGVLEIPSVSFSGRELLPGRSLLGARLGRRIALQSKAIEITVKPVPSNFPGDVWLPARHIEIASLWSTPPDRLTVGDSSTRTIEITAEGLQGSQLPPLSSLMDGVEQPGLKFYPDQETIEQREVSSGIEGYRLQSEALVATTAGSWTLPELVIPWWDTDTDTLQYARLPAAQIAITTPTTLSTPELTNLGVTSMRPEAEAKNTLWAWQVMAIVGWCLVIILVWLIWRVRRSNPISLTAIKPLAATSSRTLVALRLACSANNPQAAREALLDWARQRLPHSSVFSLANLAETCSPALSQEIRQLDACLWGHQENTWRGDKLFGLIKSEANGILAKDGDDVSLYPP